MLALTVPWLPLSLPSSAFIFYSIDSISRWSLIFCLMKSPIIFWVVHSAYTTSCCTAFSSFLMSFTLSCSSSRIFRIVCFIRTTSSSFMLLKFSPSFIRPSTSCLCALLAFRFSSTFLRTSSSSSKTSPTFRLMDCCRGCKKFGTNPRGKSADINYALRQWMRSFFCFDSK